MSFIRHLEPLQRLRGRRPELRWLGPSELGKSSEWGLEPFLDECRVKPEQS